MTGPDCPDCGNPFEIAEEPDLVFLDCPRCGALFMERDVLGPFSSGLAVPLTLPASPEKRRPLCPRCPGREMEERVPEHLSEVHVWWCVACRGVLVPPRGIEVLHDALSREDPGQCLRFFRGYRGGKLVRVEVVNATEIGVDTGPAHPVAGAYCLLVRVYLRRPLGLGLRIAAEDWWSKVKLTMGWTDLRDIETEDRQFDVSFVVQGDRPDDIRRLLTEPVRRTLVEAAERGPRMFSTRGALTVHDTHVEYFEGPYRDLPSPVRAKGFGALLERLIDLAGRLDEASRDDRGTT